MKPTCFHLRRVSDNLKVVGGTVPKSCATLDEAAEWLSEGAPVVVSNTGSVQFTYGGTPVYAYLSVDPSETDIGKEALRQWRIEERNRQDAEAEHNRDLERELEDLIDALGIDVAVQKLRDR